MSDHVMNEGKADRSAHVNLASPYSSANEGHVGGTPISIWATVLGEVFVLKIDTLAGATVGIHLTRDGLTELWEMLADLDAGTPTANYDSMREAE
jgi:hypothetical protein